MRVLAVIACLAAAATPAAAESVEVPSGRAVEFVEILTEVPGADDATWRFRFIAPELARENGAVPLDETAADMDALCAEFVLPRLSRLDARPERVVISISDRLVPFGQAAPDAVQIFEAYGISDGDCEWEGF